MSFKIKDIKNDTVVLPWYHSDAHFLEKDEEDSVMEMGVDGDMRIIGHKTDLRYKEQFRNSNSLENMSIINEGGEISILNKETGELVSDYIKKSIIKFVENTPDVIIRRTGRLSEIVHYLKHNVVNNIPYSQNLYYRHVTFNIIILSRFYRYPLYRKAAGLVDVVLILSRSIDKMISKVSDMSISKGYYALFKIMIMSVPHIADMPIYIDRFMDIDLNPINASVLKNNNGRFITTTHTIPATNDSFIKLMFDDCDNTVALEFFKDFVSRFLIGKLVNNINGVASHMVHVNLYKHIENGYEYGDLLLPSIPPHKLSKMILSE